MLTEVDHVVVAVADLDEAINNYRGLGFTVVPGGEHPTAGWHNALIAFKRLNPEHRWYDLIAKGGGLVDYCMQTDDLWADMAALRAAGVAMSDISPLSRVRPDGYRLDWVLTVAEGAFRGVAPFLIEDITPRPERVPTQIAHDNGVTGIETVTVTVRDSAPPREWYRRLLNLSGDAIARADVKARGLRFKIGPHAFDYISPDVIDSPLKVALNERGPSIYGITLKTTSQQTGPLDPNKTLNARLALVSG